MTNRLTKLSVTTYTPGTPAVPGSPARCYTTSVSTVIYQYLGTVYGAQSKNGKLVLTNKDYQKYKTANFIQALSNVGDSWSTVGYAFYYTYTKVTKQTICDPAVPAQAAVPSSTSVDNQIGWNAGARSRQAISGDFVMTFSVPRLPVAVAAGASAATTNSTSISGIEHGLYATANQFAVIESGVTVAVSPYTPAQYQQVTIRRADGLISYQIGDWHFTSIKRSSGTKRLSAALYAAGDFIDSPVISQAALLSGETVFGWDGAAAGVERLRGRTSFGWTSQAASKGRMSIQLPALQGAFSDRRLGSLRVNLPALRMNAYGGMPTVNAGGFEVAVPMVVGFTGRTGEVGGMDVTMPAAIGMMSDRLYGSMQVKLPPLFATMLQSTDAAGERNVATALHAIDAYLLDPTIYVMVSEELQVGASIDLLIVMDVDLVEYLAVGDEVDARMILEVMLASGFVASDNLSQVRRDLVQYATNIATGAVSRYENFGFTSFCRVGMRTFGVRQDGVYELAGETDNGALLSAAVEFAVEEFGTAQKKHVDFVYLGLDTDGCVLLKVRTDDGQERAYRTKRNGPAMRAQTAKGVNSRYWQLRLELTDASVAELENIEWSAAVSNRRLGR